MVEPKRLTQAALRHRKLPHCEGFISPWCGPFAALHERHLPNEKWKIIRERTDATPRQCGERAIEVMMITCRRRAS
jgi:hypothetical protein